MININFDDISTEELIEIYKIIEDFLKHLQSEIGAVKKVNDGN